MNASEVMKRVMNYHSERTVYKNLDVKSVTKVGKIIMNDIPKIAEQILPYSCGPNETRTPMDFISAYQTMVGVQLDNDAQRYTMLIALLKKGEEIREMAEEAEKDANMTYPLLLQKFYGRYWSYSKQAKLLAQFKGLCFTGSPREMQRFAARRYRILLSLDWERPIDLARMVMANGYGDMLFREQ